MGAAQPRHLFAQLGQDVVDEDAEATGNVDEDVAQQRLEGETRGETGRGREDGLYGGRGTGCVGGEGLAEAVAGRSG